MLFRFCRDGSFILLVNKSLCWAWIGKGMSAWRWGARNKNIRYVKQIYICQFDSPAMEYQTLSWSQPGENKALWVYTEVHSTEFNVACGGNAIWTKHGRKSHWINHKSNNFLMLWFVLLSYLYENSYSLYCLSANVYGDYGLCILLCSV